MIRKTRGPMGCGIIVWGGSAPRNSRELRSLKAGDTLHREIADGFDRSCAVIFFVTTQFKDERWLKREVDHAVARKVERGDRFAIISLAFENAEVPRPLKEMLWITVKNEVSAVREILRALPVEVGPTRWRK